MNALNMGNKLFERAWENKQYELSLHTLFLILYVPRNFAIYSMMAFHIFFSICNPPIHHRFTKACQVFGWHSQAFFPSQHPKRIKRSKSFFLIMCSMNFRCLFLILILNFPPAVIFIISSMLFIRSVHAIFSIIL